VKVSEYYVTKLVTTENASAAGTLLDKLIALCFIDLNGKRLCDIPCFAPIPELPTDEYIDITSVADLKENNTKSLADLISRSTGSKFILPKHYAGLDGIYRTPSVWLINGDKTTTQKTPTNKKKSVDFREVESNYDITDLTNLFGNSRDSQKLKEKQNIWDYLLNYPPRAIIRLHVLLPYPPNITKNNISFSHMLNTTQVTKVSDYSQYTSLPLDENHHPTKKPKTTCDISKSAVVYKVQTPTYVVNIDTNHLHTCGLFLPAVANYLASYYPATKIQDPPSNKYRLNSITKKRRKSDTNRTTKSSEDS
jgi:hypothetical protein